MAKYFRIFLIIVFLAATAIIVFLQYTSNKNIDQLITSNENLLHAQEIKNELRKLQKNIYAMDAELRIIIINNHKKGIHFSHFYREDSAIQHKQKIFTRLETDTISHPIILQLQHLINKKLTFNHALLDSFNLHGKTSAEKIINAINGTTLSDSINALINNIDAIHEKYVQKLIQNADINGKKAKIYGSVLAVLAVIASLLTFGYISLISSRQSKMITKLHTSESKAKESAILKERFLANMSHEIRTPLHAVLGFTQLLQKKSLDKESMQFVDYIESAGSSLLHIVNDILDISKIESNMMRIQNMPFNIKQLIHTIVTVYRIKALEKNIILKASIDISVPDIISGDEARLNQIITNLTGNAIKFTQKGEVNITCSRINTNDNTDTISISVSDTGIGIKNEELKSIFERFHQSDDAINRKYNGTGLGLTIVKDLVSLMNGHIYVESDYGNGSKFTVILPFEEVKTVTVPTHEYINDDEVCFYKNSTILIVEDNAINRVLISKLVQSFGIEYSIAENGKAAIEQLLTHSFDLILMDIQMPEMDGYNTTAYIRQQLHIHTPIIAMTAHLGEKENCIQYGMNDYLSKPVNPIVLKQLLAKYLSEKKSAQPVFKYISTDYLKSISLGNADFEKTICRQFINTATEELENMKEAGVLQNKTSISTIAHSMKTTVAIMGILPLVQEHLDMLEHAAFTNEQFNRSLDTLSAIFTIAIDEAKVLLNNYKN